MAVLLAPQTISISKHSDFEYLVFKPHCISEFICLGKEKVRSVDKLSKFGAFHVEFVFVFKLWWSKSLFILFPPFDLLPSLSLLLAPVLMHSEIAEKMSYKMSQ